MSSNLSRNPTVAEYADYYVTELGFALGTVREGTKIPDGGPNNVTRDPEVIKATLGRHPGRGIFANLAESGVIEIEADVRGDHDGHDDLRALEDRLGALPPTFTVTTPSGGTKRLYKRPQGFKGRNRNLPDRQGHVELRVNGSFTLPPTSYPGGGFYAWVEGHGPGEVEIAELPPEWIDYQREQERQNEEKFRFNGQKILEGHRRRELLRYAGALVKAGTTGDLLDASVHLANEQKCDPPLSTSEVEQNILKSAHEWEPGDPPRVLVLGRERSSSEDLGDWPQPMDKAAYHGVIGRIVEKVGPHTEADDHAVLLQLVAFVGNAAGRTPHIRVEADRHGANLFVCIVADTSSGRKGTSKGQALRPVAAADPHWAAERQASGLSSGEGLIFAVRDRITKTKLDGDEERVIVVDEGVLDKRLMVTEPEFASALKVARREGNILSPNVRQAWDGHRLQTLTRTAPLKASEPHVSIVAHITPDELRRELISSEQANGFANRFLFALVTRSKLLPFGGDIESEDFSDEIAEIKTALMKARFRRKAIPIAGEARDFWAETYEELVRDRPGQLGNLLARAPSHVLRIALIYALLDQSPTINVEHLRAGLAVWRYVERSTRIIFKTATGDVLADRLLGALRDAGRDGLSKTDLHEKVGRNRTAVEIASALDTLADQGLADRTSVATGGRPSERWTLRTNEANEERGEA